MKRIIALCLILVSLTCHAARPEWNMPNMVISLHQELQIKWSEIVKNKGSLDETMQKFGSTLSLCDEESTEGAMNIYSTGDDSFQEIAFANKNALDSYRLFCKYTGSFVSMQRECELSIKRQDSLMTVLSTINDTLLTKETRPLLSEAMTLLRNIQEYDREKLRKLQAFNPLYNAIKQRMELNVKICEDKYDIIRSNVLYNFDDNVLDILSDFGGYLDKIEKQNANRRYASELFVNEHRNLYELITMDDTANYPYTTIWGNETVLGVVAAMGCFFLIAVCFALLVCLVRFIIKKVCKLKVWEGTPMQGIVSKIHGAMQLLSGLRLFVLVTVWGSVLLLYELTGDATETTFGHLFLYMNYSMGMIAFVITCFLLRYKGREYWRAMAIAAPTMIVFAYALLCIVMVLPDVELIVEVTFISIVTFALQLYMHYRWQKEMDAYMLRLSRLSVWFNGIAMVIALVGLQFLSMMFFVFWCSFMLFVMLLTGVKERIDKWISKWSEKERPVKMTWWVPVLNTVLYPMAWVYAVLLSTNVAFTLFQLDDFFEKMLDTYFATPIGNISINISLVIFACWNILLASYLSKMICRFVESYHEAQDEKNWGETHMFQKNLIVVLTWGVAVVNIMLRMGFGMEWVGYALGGLGTGLGFACRGIMENVIYGLSLRGGQLKVGDWIVFGNLRGQIRSIGLLSTSLDTMQGSVVSFANTRLFRKEYENITLEQGYELLHTKFCIAVDEDVDRVRKLLVDAYAKTHYHDEDRPVSVYCEALSDKRIDLDFRTWIPVADRPMFTAINMEFVYKTLKENEIKLG